jgi:hypothetical protein
MGTLQTNKELRGLGLPDRRVTFENLNPVDGSPTGSDFDEAGPRPGTAIGDDPRSKLLVEIQNAQGEDLEVYVVRSGSPGPDSSAEIVYRESDESSGFYDGWRAWNRPSFLHHCHGWQFETLASISTFDAAVIPSTQELVLVYARDGGLFARATSAVGEKTLQPTGAGIGDCAVVVLPDERILAITTSGPEAAYYSDDAGNTWNLYAEGLFPGLASANRTRAVLSGDLICLIRKDTAGNIRQFVSRDLGASFELVDDSLSFGDFPELVALPDGSVGMVYKSTGFFQNPQFRRIGSPFESFADAVARIVDPSVLFVTSMVDACADPDGVLHVIGRDNVGDSWRVFSSTDFGESWTQSESDVWKSTIGGPRPPNGKLLSVDGGYYWFTQWNDADGGVDLYSIQALFLGGWSNVGTNPLAGWGESTGTFAELDGATYLPIAPPGGASSPFTVSGAGSEAIVQDLPDNGVLQVTTSGTVRNYTDSLLGLSTPGRFKGTFYFRHVSGGTTVPFNGGPGFDVLLCDGTDDYHFEVRVDEQANPVSGILETVFRVVDLNSGAILAGPIVPLENSLGRTLQFLVDMDGELGTLELQWRPSGVFSPVDQWRTLYSGNLTNDTTTPGTIGRVRWGNGNLVSTAVTNWILVAYKAAEDPTFQQFFAYDLPTTAFSSTDFAGKRGRSIGAIGFPLGSLEGLLPAFRELETKTVLAALRGGPARFGESYSIPASHEFGVENVFAELSPSPSSTFRTRTRRPVTLAWSFDEKSRIGDSWILGVLLLRTNFRKAFVDVDVSPGGAGTWVQIGEVNPAQGFEGLSFVREGDQVRPDRSAPTATAERYLHRNELAGGIFESSGNATRILGNTSGRWSASSNAVAPVLTLEDGSVVGSSGTCAILPPRALRVIHLDGTAADFVTGVRIRFDASLLAVSGEDYLEAGAVRLVALVPFGQQPSRGWSQEMIPNASETVSRSGTIRKRFEGPPARRWTWSWPDGVKMDRIRGEEAPDYLGVSGKPPAMTKEDVWTLLWGFLEETRSGELPVVALNRFPKSTVLEVTLTDRTLFLFGTLDGSGRFDQVLGSEDVDEFGRVSPIAIRELV